MSSFSTGYTSNIVRVIYTGTLWIGVGYATGIQGYTSGAVALKSTDGSTWSDWIINNTSGGYTDVYWDGIYAVAVGPNILASAFGGSVLNGTWQNQNPWSTVTTFLPSNFNYNFVGVVSNGTTWVAVGSQSVTGSAAPPTVAIFVNIPYTNTASTQWGWTQSSCTTVGVGTGTPSIAPMNPQGVVCNTIALLPNGLFIIGTSIGSLYTSPDGNNWTQIYTSTAPMIPQRILMNNYANNTIFMATYQQGVWYSTNNGVTWNTIVYPGLSATTYVTDIRMINATTAIAVGNVNITERSITQVFPLVATINVTVPPTSLTALSLPTTFVSNGIQTIASTYTPIFPVVPLVFGSSLIGTAPYQPSFYQYNGIMTTSYTYYNVITPPSTTGTNQFYKIIYTGNLWLATATIQNPGNYVYIYSSNDSINWTANKLPYGSSNNPIQGILYDICWNGSMAIAVGANGNFPLMYYSIDMINWLLWTPPSYYSVNLGGGQATTTFGSIMLHSVIYTGGTGGFWIAAGVFGYTPPGSAAVNYLYCIISSDGINWTQSSSLQNANIQTLGPTVNFLVTLGTYRGMFYLSTGNAVYNSATGNTWNLSVTNATGGTLSSTFTITKIMKINSVLVVAGFDTSTNVFAYYFNGLQWNSSSTPITTSGGANMYTINDIKMISPTMGMMVGSISTSSSSSVPLVLVSSDGMTWTRINSGYGAATGQSQIQTFSGTYSEFVLCNNLGTVNNGGAGTLILSSSISAFTSYNTYVSIINAIPTYIYFPYLGLTYTGTFNGVQLTMTVAQSQTGGLTTIATGTFMLNQAYPNGISIPLTTVPGVFIQPSATNAVSYTLSVTPTGIGSAQITAQTVNGNLSAILYGRTYFLTSSLTLPTATSGGTQFYIPSPITYLAGKKSYGNLISTAVIGTSSLSTITYTSTTTTTNGTADSVALATNPVTNTQGLQLTLGSSQATINVIASFPGNNKYAATSVTKTVYTKNYNPVIIPGANTAMFFNYSGLSTPGASVPQLVGYGAWRSFNNSAVTVTINITNSVTLSEFNFGYASLAFAGNNGFPGYSGYAAAPNNTQIFTMTVQNVSNPNTPITITTVQFTVISPPSGAQPIGSLSPLTAAQYYAATYNETVNNGNTGANDGTLLSIPFYDISNNLPTYVTSFSIAGTPLPTFNLGDTIQIALTSTAAFSAYTSLDGGLCGTLINQPIPSTSSTPNNVATVYNGALTYPSAISGTTPYTTALIQIGTFSISSQLTNKTMFTGFNIVNIGLTTPQFGISVTLQLNVYKNVVTTPILTINFLCYLPNASYSNTNLFIPFSYASDTYNTIPSSLIITSISFTGTQNPIFNISDQVSCSLSQLSTPISLSYLGVNGQFSSLFYGTTMPQTTNLAFAATTPIRGVLNTAITFGTTVVPGTGSNLIYAGATTFPTGVGGAITYQISKMWSGLTSTMDATNTTFTVNYSTSVGTAGRVNINANQAGTATYSQTTASSSFDLIAFLPTSNNPTFYLINANNATYIANMATIAGGYTLQSVSSISMYANILFPTTIIGFSFAYNGSYQFPANYVLIMTIYKVSGSTPTTSLATMMITTTTSNYNSNADGTLFIIPFINGNTFSLNTFPITVMPTCISAVSGNITDPNKLAFQTGDTIQITLSSTAGQSFTAGSSFNGNLVGSILCSSQGNEWNPMGVYSWASSGYYDSSGPYINFANVTMSQSITGGLNGSILTGIMIPSFMSTSSTTLIGKWTLAIQTIVSGNYQVIFTIIFNISSVSSASWSIGVGQIMNGYATPPINLTFDAIQMSPQPNLSIVQMYGLSTGYTNSYPKIANGTTIAMQLSNNNGNIFYYQSQASATLTFAAGGLMGIGY